MHHKEDVIIPIVNKIRYFFQLFPCLKETLKKHVDNVHERKKPHECSQCDAAFAQKSTLNSHVLSVHECKKQYQCSTCDYVSVFKGQLVRHNAEVHEGKKPFKCSVCSYRSYQKISIDGH